MLIYHLLAPEAWAAALEVGEYRPQSLTDEGFVHFSFAEQVEGTANLLYADVHELIVIGVDADRLGGPHVLVEDAPGTDQSFPHVYGAVPTAAAVGQHPMVRDAAGRWVFDPTR